MRFSLQQVPARFGFSTGAGGTATPRRYGSALSAVLKWTTAETLTAERGTEKPHF